MPTLAGRASPIGNSLTPPASASAFIAERASWRVLIDNIRDDMNNKDATTIVARIRVNCEMGF